MCVLSDTGEVKNGKPPRGASKKHVAMLTGLDLDKASINPKDRLGSWGSLGH